MIDQEAIALSRRMSAPDMFPEAREAFARTLFDYYKSLLSRANPPKVPTPRRWL